MNDNINIIIKSKTKFLFLLYVILCFLYIIMFGLFYPSSDFKIEVIIKAVTMAVLCYSMFSQKKKLFIGLVVVSGILYFGLLAKIFYIVIHTLADYGPVQNPINLFVTFIIKYGFRNVEGFESTFVTLIPGLYFLVIFMKRKVTKNIYSIIMLLVVILSVYFVLRIYIPEFTKYIDEVGYDIFNPLHNTLMFSVMIDYLLFPIYIVCNMVRLNKETN
jgi:hypothetical protein